METGLKFILSFILLCVTATLFIAINFVYKDVFKVKYEELPEINNVEAFDSYNKGILEELNNSYKYKYKYLRNNKSYYKLTIKNFDSKDYGYLDLRFKYMSDSFDILN